MKCYCGVQVEELKKTQCTTETDEIVTSAALETALTGADNSDGKPTPEQLQFYEKNKNRIGEALMQQVVDDGFSVLGADEYLAVRTKPSLERMIKRLPKLSSKRKMLQVRGNLHLSSAC
jgi:ribosome-binding ATPase YchF (GTP1/OBG family)